MSRFIKRDSDGSTIDLEKQEAEHADLTANSKRVILTDSSGNIIQSTVSTNNSTTTTLGNGEVFTGTGEDISQYSGISIIIFSDQDSATDGLSFEWSSDNTNWDHMQLHTVTANQSYTTQVMMEAQYFRIVYTNGTTPQSNFRLQTILMRNPSLGEIQQLRDVVNDEADAQLVRSVISGKTPAGPYINLGATNGGNLKFSLEEFDEAFNTNPLPVSEKSKTAFGEILVGELYPQFQGSFEYTVDNTNLNTNVVVNDGTVTQASGMAVVGSSTTTASTACFQSKQHAKYRPGLGGLSRFTALFTSPIAATEQYIGLADETGSDAATGTVTLTGGGSGSVDGITVDSIEIMSGAENFDTDLTETARNVVTNINAHTSDPNYSATSLGTVITIKSDVLGTGANGFVVSSSTTTITTTDVNLSGGTDGEAFENGYMVGYDGTTFGFHRFQNDTKTTVAQSAWDDPMDGTGASGMTLDQTKLNVFEIKYQYLGAGAIQLLIEDDSTGQFVVAHTILYANNNTEPSVHNPNFFHTMWVNNKATISNLILKSSSYSYFVEGRTSFIELHQPDHSSGIKEKTSVTTEVAIFTIRNKATYFSKTNFIDIILQNLTTAIEASSANNIGQIRLLKNATLGGVPSYADINTSDSVVEIDTAGTTVTGGEEIAFFLLAGKNDKGLEDLSKYRLIINPGETITLAGLSANSATIDGALLWRELF